MSQTNFEAIGRCKVLREKIDKLEVERNRAISELSSYMRSLTGSIKGAIYTFDPNKGHDLLKSIEAADLHLMRAVDEFNEWASQAGERAYSLNEPVER